MSERVGFVHIQTYLHAYARVPILNERCLQEPPTYLLIDGIVLPSRWAVLGRLPSTRVACTWLWFTCR